MFNGAIVHFSKKAVHLGYLFSTIFSDDREWQLSVFFVRIITFYYQILVIYIYSLNIDYFIYFFVL